MSCSEAALRERIADAERVVFFTGAGMSAESGVATYRGKGGIWAGYNYEDYACEAAFERDPERVWDFHDKRRERTARARPHAGHLALARFLEARPGSVIITQNIDGLHQLAGARRVLELHGSLWRVRCGRCGTLEDNREVPIGARRHACGAYLRPGIVWFGDLLPEHVLSEVIDHARAAEVFISIGTSAVVYPAAHMPVYARQGGALLIEVNPEETPLSDLYDAALRTPASAALAALLPSA